MAESHILSVAAIIFTAIGSAAFAALYGYHRGVKDSIKIVEIELEYPTPWPADRLRRFRGWISSGELSPQVFAQEIVAATKKSIVKRLRRLLHRE